MSEIPSPPARETNRCNCNSFKRWGTHAWNCPAKLAPTEERCYLCGDPKSKHTKKAADWRTVPGCVGAYAPTEERRTDATTTPGIEFQARQGLDEGTPQSSVDRRADGMAQPLEPATAAVSAGDVSTCPVAHAVAPPVVPVGAAPVEQKEEPYFIEVEKNGCERCGRGKLWAVVCPGGDILGVSFEDEEAASELAEHMNTAYWAGRGSAEPPV